MGDDLGTPAAVAAIHNLVREGYKLFAVGASERLRAAVHGARHGPPMWNGVEPVILTSVQVGL